MKTDDGGPAFPCEPNKCTMDGHGEIKPFGFPGMSLRDYFAAKAMAEAINACNRIGAQLDNAVLARLSYEMADAMLAERAK